GLLADHGFRILQDSWNESLRKPCEKAPDDEKSEVLAWENQAKGSDIWLGGRGLRSKEPYFAKSGEKGTFNNFRHQEKGNNHCTDHANTPGQENRCVFASILKPADS